VWLVVVAPGVPLKAFPALAALVLAALVPAACGGGSSAPNPVASTVPSPSAVQELRGAGVVVGFQPPDAVWAPVVHADGLGGRENALRFFGAPIVGELRIEMFPDRASLTAHWRRIFQSPGFQSECWMIASGNTGGIALLSPGAWAREACGHDAQDPLHRSRITHHEVVHVHHAQSNPAWGVTNDGLGWLTEGLAVHASGQLDDESRALVRREVAAGRVPTRLVQVLPAGYNWAGSLVEWIDRRYGRAALVDLLDETQEAAVLRRLDATESGLLEAWQADVAAGR
jgi:hypothetical protein